MIRSVEYVTAAEDVAFVMGKDIIDSVVDYERGLHTGQF